MSTIKYSITFLSEWHSGSGLTSGSDLDALVIKNKHNLPYLPGRTLKGLLKDAAETLIDLGKEAPDGFIDEIFGNPLKHKDENAEVEEIVPTQEGQCYFSSANLPEELVSAIVSENLQELMFRTVSATAIEFGKSIAKPHSLRRIQTTIPCCLYAEINNFPDNDGYLDFLESCLKLTKRLGLSRNRGLGRCQFNLI